jgi:hypothetical protein
MHRATLQIPMQEKISWTHMHLTRKAPSKVETILRPSGKRFTPWRHFLPSAQATEMLAGSRSLPLPVKYSPGFSGAR